MASSERVKTRILCISDTHSGRPSDFYSDEKGFRKPLPKANILIHSGDLSMTGRIEEYEHALDMLKDIDAELKLVIAGNHDLTLDEEYVRQKLTPDGMDALKYSGQLEHLNEEGIAERAKELWTGVMAAEAGVTYLTEGFYTFTLKNGVTFKVYASPWQPEFLNWAFNYPHHEDRWNRPETITQLGVVGAPPEQDPHPIPSEENMVDIVITHGPPHMHLDKCRGGPRAGCPHLLKALSRVRPRLHVFGHIHEAWGAERVTWKDNKVREWEDNSTINIGRTCVRDAKDDITPNDPEVKEKKAAYIDLSSDSNTPLKEGQETLMVNACIVDLAYNAENAGWLVDLDLPMKS